ncbi:hypothetical protein DEO72_LG8g3014 [Vigna unguiculata]|uniref:Uncharacterized protein n=1 Tax=Vigna unguiculata TaxID=3917 RepID=A0A4D6MWI0_VIGUN|nr:hypothetical protein DEO72_LG8g3014 [Vigna unguiculata]
MHMQYNIRPLLRGGGVSGVGGGVAHRWREWCWRWSGAPVCWSGDNALAVRGGAGRCWGGEWMAQVRVVSEAVSCGGGEVLWCWGWMASVAPVFCVEWTWMRCLKSAELAAGGGAGLFAWMDYTVQINLRAQINEHEYNIRPLLRGGGVSGVGGGVAHRWREWCWRWSGAPVCWSGDNALAVRGGAGRCWGGEWMAQVRVVSEAVSCGGGEVLWCWGWMASVAPVFCVE